MGLSDIKGGLFRAAPGLYRGAHRVRQILGTRVKITKLARGGLSRLRLAELSQPEYAGIYEDLLAYTGFSEDELEPYLLRRPDKHFETEFNWFAPKSRAELTWFYRCSSGYVFANAVHPYDQRLDVIEGGRVLDYGAGVGCNTLGLARRNLHVDFVEISRMQADFLRFRAKRKGYTNVRGITPEFEGGFDPIQCVQDRYDAIVAMDVLEHVPDYHIVLRHLIDRLDQGGLIVENSPFDPDADEIAIHVRPSIPLEEAMVGMTRIDKGVWRKG